MIKMKIINSPKVYICKNVAVYNHKWLIIPEIRNIFYSSSRTKNQRFITGKNRDGIFPAGQERIYLFIQVMGINNYGFATRM